MQQEEEKKNHKQCNVGWTAHKCTDPTPCAWNNNQLRINDLSFTIIILSEPVISSLLPLFSSRIACIPYYLAALPIIYFVLPSVLAVLPQKPQFLLKCIVVLLATLAMSVAGCFISIICAILDKRYAINYIVSRLFSHLAAKPCGVTYRIVGEEHLETYPAIVVCNHQSSMDMMVLGRVFPKHCVVMAKKELLYFPFLGMFSKYLCYLLEFCLCARSSFIISVSPQGLPHRRYVLPNNRQSTKQSTPHGQSVSLQNIFSGLYCGRKAQGQGHDLATLSSWGWWYNILDRSTEMDQRAPKLCQVDHGSCGYYGSETRKRT